MKRKPAKQEFNKLRKKLFSGKPLTKRERKKFEEYNLQELYSPEVIDYNLDPSLTIPEYARTPLAKSLALLPYKVIDFITENYTFISLPEDIWGQHWVFDEVRQKHKIGFILLNSNFWKEKPMQIAFTIAHEVAHAWKRHRVAITGQKGIKQEREADELAVKWLSKHYKKEGLIKLRKSQLRERWHKKLRNVIN